MLQIAQCDDQIVYNLSDDNLSRQQDVILRADYDEKDIRVNQFAFQRDEKSSILKGKMRAARQMKLVETIETSYENLNLEF